MSNHPTQRLLTPLFLRGLRWIKHGKARFWDDRKK
jgi:hypothetical protein